MKRQSVIAQTLKWDLQRSEIRKNSDVYSVLNIICDPFISGNIIKTEIIVHCMHKANTSKEIMPDILYAVKTNETDLKCLLLGKFSFLPFL